MCRPHHAPCPWLAETRPATQDLMGALQVGPACGCAGGRLQLPYVDSQQGRPKPCTTILPSPALQGVANAAVEDLERPDLQFRLSPHALHALGLILEEAALEELGSRLRI